MQRVGRAIAGLIASLVLACPAAAFSDLFVFGDSLSDVGNTSASTLGLQPGGAYFNGRFSNGPVYSELIADALGLGPLTRSGAGGDNFAFGGAETAGPGGFVGLFINGLDEQVDDFISNRDPDPDALHIVWAGANDLLGGQTNLAVPVGNLAGEITELYDDGARQFLVLNLPDLGATPRFNSNASDASTFSARTDAFNSQLDGALDGLEASLLDIDLVRFDIAGVFDDLLADPASFGLTNVTDQAIGNGSANPDEYLFWDEVHPTAAVHALLADQIAALLLAIPGDLNGDTLRHRRRLRRAARRRLRRRNLHRVAGELRGGGRVGRDCCCAGAFGCLALGDVTYRMPLLYTWLSLFNPLYAATL